LTRCFIASEYPSQNGRVGDLGSIFVLALTAMFNPTLLAAVTLMMLLPDTRKLMLGYLLGAYLASISLGFLIVFSLHGSASVDTARTTLTPGEDLVFGFLALVAGVVLRTGRLGEARERRRQHKEDKSQKESLPQRLLGRGSARITFVVGMALTLPGASYLVALKQIADLGAGKVPSAALVVAFCLIQMAFLELPLIGYALAPESTQRRVEAFRDWLARSGPRVAGNLALAIGALLVVRGAIELITA
jgi:Sap-like sulfolipid-1-addressing protein